MITIFVAKLDFGVTENELFDLFKQYGTVAKVTVAKDRETKNSRGFAFVEMPNRDEVQQAIDALDGYTFNGRKCVIKEAESREGNKNDGPRGDQSFKPKYPNAERDQRPNKPTISGDDSDEHFIPIAKTETEFIPKDKPLPVKKKKEPEKPKPYDNTADGKTKKQKMNAYKKSGKDTIQFENDDLDDDINLFGEDDSEDEDYKKYLINQSEEEDEDWDEDEEWDEDDEWDEDE